MQLQPGFRRLTVVCLSLSAPLAGCSKERNYAPIPAVGTSDSSDHSTADAGDANLHPEPEAGANPNPAADASARPDPSANADASTNPDASASPGAAVDASATGDAGDGITDAATGDASTIGTVAAFIPLGILSGGSFSYTTGVDDAGEVIAGYADSLDGDRAVMWLAQGNGFSGPVLVGDPGAQAKGVSGDGKYLVGSAASGIGQHAVRWRVSDGALEDLIPASSDSMAYASNRDGSVIVGVSDGVAFRWTPNSIKYLGGGEAFGVSASGEVVVGGGSATAAFRWNLSDEMRVDIPGLQLAASSRATALSRDGKVAVGYSFGDDGSVLAFRQEINTLAATLGTRSYQAYASDESGAVVGGDSPAWLWTPSAGVVELSDVLTSASIDVSDWYLNRISGITQGGAVLVGDGTESGVLSGSQGFVVRLRPGLDF